MARKESFLSVKTRRVITLGSGTNSVTRWEIYPSIGKETVRLNINKDSNDVTITLTKDAAINLCQEMLRELENRQD